MPTRVFNAENGSSEEWIDVNDDGTVTRHIENAGWIALKSGLMPREETLAAAYGGPSAAVVGTATPFVRQLSRTDASIRETAVT